MTLSSTIEPADFRSIALAAASRGLPVIPLVFRTKVPPAALLGWSAEKLETTNRKQIEAWAQQYPIANCACVCRLQGHLILDDDADFFLNPLASVETLVVQSRPGRQQYYFLQTERSRKLGNVTQTNGLPFSVRSSGYYGLAAGSIHPNTGQPYIIIRDFPIPPIPDVIVDLIEAEITRHTPVPKPSLPPGVGRIIPEGERNTSLTSLAGVMRQKGFGTEAVAAALQIHNRQACSPPLSESEVEQIAASVGRYPLPAPEPRLILSTPVAAPAISIHCPADIPDPRNLEVAPVKCLVDGLIPLGQITLICGEPSSGKTWFGMLLARALVRGEPFLDRESIQCENVTYVDRENPLAVIRERFDSLFREEEPAFRHWGLWLADDQPPDFSSPRYEEFAAAGAVLIFDSLTRFHCSAENSPTEMSQVFGCLRRLQARGASLIILHHRDKKLESGYRGTAEIAAGCDVMYSFSREKTEDLRTLKLIKARTALDAEISFRVDWDKPAITPTENVLTMKRRETCSLISKILRGNSEGVKQSDIIVQMEQQGVSRSQTQRTLNGQEGKLWFSTGGGKGIPKTYRERIVIR